MSAQRTLDQSSPPCHLCTYQGAPSSLTRSQATSKGSGVPGEISSTIRDRRHDFPRGSCLWSPLQSLSWHEKNAFTASGQCDCDQYHANTGMVGGQASGHNTHVQIRCFSFDCLSLEVRQQYQSETEPLWKCLAKPDSRCQQFYDRMTIVGKKKALSFHHQEITNTSLKLQQSEIMQKNLTAKLTAELRENQRQWRTSTNKRPQAKNHRSAPKAAQATTLPAVDRP
jgi:hypothetical protein